VSLTISSLIYQFVSETFISLMFVRIVGINALAAGFFLWAGLIFGLHFVTYLALHYTVDIPIVLADGHWSVQDIFNSNRAISVAPGTVGAAIGMVAQRSLRALICGLLAPDGPWPRQLRSWAADFTSSCQAAC